MTLLPRLNLRPRWRYAPALGLASALAISGGFACSDNLEPPPSEIMIALQTDMSLPKDVSSIRIQVLENGSLRFDKEYIVGPNGEKIPATLAIAGDPGQPVEVRVIGLRASDARTLNKVITSIPDGRIALLRMPIQWLCEGNVRQIAPDTYDSTCEPQNGEEMSCVGGTCQRVHQMPQQLPDYAPSAVFGGGNGRTGNGNCFATEQCMDDGFDVTPNMSDCTVDVAADDAQQLNFAVRSRDGDGICSGSNCYVPLDKQDEYGWRDETSGGTSSGSDAGTKEDASTTFPDGGTDLPDSGTRLDAGAQDASSGVDAAAPAPSGTGGAGALPPPLPGLRPQQTSQAGMRHVKLPQGVCDRIGDGRALGLRATTRCEAKTADVPTCGPWSSVGSQGGVNPTEDGGTPTGECPGFVPGQQVPPLTNDTAIDGYLQAVSDLYWNAEDQRTRTATACQNIAKMFGALVIEFSNPPTDAEVTSACTQAGNYLKSANATSATVGVLPGLCSANINGQQACETACQSGTGCNEQLADMRCDQKVGPCPGSCFGDCYPQQATSIQCSGTCSGRCSGTCSGSCSQLGAGNQCNGLCTGTCTGTCDGVCAMAGGPCQGTCVEDPESGYTAACDVGIQPLSCTVPLTPSTCIFDVCANVCAAQAANDQTCTQSFTTVLDTSTPSQVTEAINQNMGPLLDVTIQGQGLSLAASYLQAANESISNLTDISSTGVACVSAAANTLANSTVTINNNTAAVMNMLTGTSTGTGGGPGLDAGDGDGSTGTCIGANTIALIDDFEDTDNAISPYDYRNGLWNVFADPYGYISVSGTGSPPVSRSGSSWAYRVGSSNTIGWGASAYVEFNGGGCYNASGWNGINLWGLTTTADSLYVRVITADTVTGCMAAQGHACAYFTAVPTATNAWVPLNITWDQLTQFDGDIVSPGFDPARIVAIEIRQQNANADFWIDDLTFY